MFGDPGGSPAVLSDQALCADTQQRGNGGQCSLLSLAAASTNIITCTNDNLWPALEQLGQLSACPSTAGRGAGADHLQQRGNMARMRHTTMQDTDDRLCMIHMQGTCSLHSSLGIVSSQLGMNGELSVYRRAIRCRCFE